MPPYRNGCQSRQPSMIWSKNGRDDWIRTSDLTHPKRARYQAAPRPVSLTYYPAKDELSNRVLLRSLFVLLFKQRK